MGVHVRTNDTNSPATPAEICSKNAAVATELRGLDPKAVMKYDAPSPPTIRIRQSVTNVSRMSNSVRFEKLLAAENSRRMRTSHLPRSFKLSKHVSIF